MLYTCRYMQPAVHLQWLSYSLFRFCSKETTDPGHRDCSKLKIFTRGILTVRRQKFLREFRGTIFSTQMLEGKRFASLWFRGISFLNNLWFGGGSFLNNLWFGGTIKFSKQFMVRKSKFSYETTLGVIHLVKRVSFEGKIFLIFLGDTSSPEFLV